MLKFDVFRINLEKNIKRLLQSFSVKKLSASKL